MCLSWNAVEDQKGQFVGQLSSSCSIWRGTNVVTCPSQRSETATPFRTVITQRSPSLADIFAVIRCQTNWVNVPLQW